MHRGLDTGDFSQSLRVLALGPPWLEEAAVTIEGEGVTVDSERAADDGTVPTGEVDCVLTDDRRTIESIDDRMPVVLVAEPEAAVDVDRVLEDGVADVVTRATLEDGSLLRHRLRRAAEWSGSRHALDRQEAWYRLLAERSSAILVVVDENRKVTYVSPSVERLTGYDVSELLDGQGSEFVHPDDYDACVDAFESVYGDGPDATETCEYRIQHADGSWHVHEAAFTNRLEDPIVEGVVVSIRDVTKHRRIERELGESLERVTDAFFALDAEWRFTYVNDRAASIFGIEPEQLLGQRFLEVFPEAAGTDLERAAVDAMRSQEPGTLETYYEPYEIWIDVRLYPSQSGLSVYFRDVSDRVEREREVVDRTEQLETLVENVPVILYALDAEGTFTLSEGRGLEPLDLQPDEAVGESLFDLFADQPAICADARRALDGEPVHSYRTVGDRIFETWYRPIVRDGQLERVIGVGVDVTERTQYGRALSALQETTGRLLAVESKQAACEYVVDVAADALGLENAVVYRFDERENGLDPAAYSTTLVSTVGMPPRIQPNESVTWDAFVDGSPRLVSDVGERPLLDGDHGDVRNGLFVPLGEHGVFVALSTEPGELDEGDLDLAQLLCATAEAALDRIGRTRRLHERERELKRQNARLERLNRTGRLREDVEEHLLRAESRTEIERGVCERLIELDECVFAWIGEPDPGGTHVVRRESAGVERGYLDAVTVTTVDADAAEPAGRAVRTRSTVSVENAATSLRDGDWRPEALSRNFQSVLSIPLVYDDFLYGVLSVYADRRNAFDETIQSTLEELGEAIAYTIDAVSRKNALLSDAVTEIDLALGDETVFETLATQFETTVDLEGVVPGDDEAAVVFVALDATVEGDEVEAFDGVDEATVIGRTEERTMLRIRLTEPFLGTAVEDQNCDLRGLTADESGVRATVDVPQSVDVRQVLAGLNRRGHTVSLLARREAAASTESSRPRPGHQPLLDDLTDRQREVVQVAYHGGFFEWPRQSTGEELAASLEISPPAFHNHVRTVQQKLFSSLFARDQRSGG
ncbi:PAS domain S-box protein [Natronobeatus ordinarius]|uniref:PAS domain S-box protein n=1 Tax=Natronobeatus ordinarius TaxID=2963433 RepID=UPI0020CB8934|nr:PAS domain S-box protein [Natronobeatus ordinarius]